MSAASPVKRALFAAVAALAFFTAAETALRLAGFRWERSLAYMQFNFPRPNELYQVFVPDPKLLWRMRPGFDFGAGFAPLNQQGFRGPEFTREKPRGALRVACLGGSVTFGRAEASYPRLLARALSAQLGRPVQAMNFGVPGYSSWQGRNLLGRVLADYRPEVVVILFGWNDHWLAKGFADKDQVAAPSKASALLKPVRGLRLYQLLNKSAAFWRGKIERPRLVLRVAPDDYRANLAAMIEACRKAGARPLIATAPSAISAGKAPAYLTYLEFIRNKDDLKRLHERYNNIAREVARDTGAPLVDLDLIFQARGVADLFEDPAKDVIHPNARGDELIAASVSSRILDLVNVSE